MMPPGDCDDRDDIDAFARFLITHHSPQLRSILLSPDPNLHYPIVVEFAELLEFDPPLAHLLFSQPSDHLPHFDEAARRCQDVILQEPDFSGHKSSKKYHVHIRISTAGSPLESPETFPSIGRVRVRHRGILLTLKGTVIRSGAIKMIEWEQIYECRKCKHRFKVHPELESGKSIKPPTSCPSRWSEKKLPLLLQRSKSCEGTYFIPIEDSKVCQDFQEIKIQESTQLLGVGCIPRSISVILMNDLVDMVKAGDDVIVTGILSAKWSSDLKDVRCDLDPILLADFVRRTNDLKSEIDIPDEAIKNFEQFWSHYKATPLRGRNAILQGICPQVFGLFTVKLAVTLTLIGGVQHVDASGTKVRGESHLLLVGDPGTGKSQFLKFAAKLSNRSVITTGLGSTSAGLTVTAVKDGGEWMLEAGALVLADGGLCCIDEFDRVWKHLDLELNAGKQVEGLVELHPLSLMYSMFLQGNSLMPVFFPGLSLSIYNFYLVGYKKSHELIIPMYAILACESMIEQPYMKQWSNKLSVWQRYLLFSFSQLHDFHGHLLPWGNDEVAKLCLRRSEFKLQTRTIASSLCNSQPAGLVTTLSTRTTVFGATNPKGQYDPIQPLSVNTTLSGPLLSRFDIVLVLLDTKNPEWDAIVSSHILGIKGEPRSESDEPETNIWSLMMLRRYIYYVKEHFKPVLTKESERIISSYYQLQRRSATHNAARTTVRMLESLIRLAQAHARLMFRNEVTRLDAIAAILCVESSMTTSAIVDTVGNALHSNFTDNPDEEYAKQEELILEKLIAVE
ncbi:hypothetical protein ZIOFF_005211 [Zingiber officinale]|uniref:DNA helicase n=1 Tax=Zingiber officinale TaxID=94328 RepID=A0A8J5I9J8_ZINOF|nr:hypothetical protein ZIOFF_005211 [Zingiber officinale]